MLIGLENNYGYDKHELVEKVEDNFEYAGTDTRKGITYDCYLAPDGITYKAVCVKQQQVEEYEVLYCYEGISEGNETITLQALSSQNVVDMVRNMYGKSVIIIEVKKVMNDWQ